MDEAQTQLGAYDTGSHEIGCDLLSADEALSGQMQHRYTLIFYEYQHCIWQMTTFRQVLALNQIFLGLIILVEDLS